MTRWQTDGRSGGKHSCECSQCELDLAGQGSDASPKAAGRWWGQGCIADVARGGIVEVLLRYGQERRAP